MKIEPSPPSHLVESFHSYSDDHIAAAAERFKNNEKWRIDSTLTCLAAAVAANTKTPRSLWFKFLKHGQTQLPPKSLSQLFTFLGTDVRVSVKCFDTFSGEKIEIRGGRDKLFELIKLHRFVSNEIKLIYLLLLL